MAMVLKSMPESYDYLTTTMETRSDDDLTMEFVKNNLLDEAQKRMEKTHRSESISRVGPEKKITYHRCRKPGHMKRDCPMGSNNTPTSSTMRDYSRKNGNFSSSGGHRESMKPKPKGKVAKSSEFSFIVGVVSKKREQLKSWIIDSGATSHMCCDRAFFNELKQSTGVSITLTDGNETVVKGVGSGHLHYYDENGDRRKITLNDVYYYVPELESNLISVGKLVNKGAKVTFDKIRGCVVECDGILATVSEEKYGLYQLKSSMKRSMKVVHHTKDCIHSWHRKLGHRAIQRIAREGLAKGISIKKCEIVQTCECCVEGKIARKPFPPNTERQSTRVLDLAHTDICGPINTATSGGSRYFLTMIDDFSRYTMVYFFKRKSEAAEVIEEYVTMVPNRFRRSPIVIRSDQGGEYKSKRLGQFYRAKGIVPQFTVGYSPQQNGFAERKNRTLVEMAAPTGWSVLIISFESTQTTPDRLRIVCYIAPTDHSYRHVLVAPAVQT